MPTIQRCYIEENQSINKLKKKGRGKQEQVKEKLCLKESTTQGKMKKNSLQMHLCYREMK